MTNIQSIIENIDESKFYLVEHVFENAIKRFCEQADNDQISIVENYTKLIKEGKMSKSLEIQLSKEITPYLETYIGIYTPYIFQGIEESESESEFNFSSYRNKVGNDVVLELFGKIGKRVATIGSVLTAAAAATWSIKDPEGMQKAIDTIVTKTGESADKVGLWVKTLFVNEPEKPDTVVEAIITKAKTLPGDITKEIKEAGIKGVGAVSGAAKKFWDYTVKQWNAGSGPKLK